MQLTRFGRTGMSVSRLCLGTATFGKQTDEAESHRILDAAADAGINFLDTANFYPMGAAHGAARQHGRDHRTMAQRQAPPLYRRIKSRGAHEPARRGTRAARASICSMRSTPRCAVLAPTAFSFSRTVLGSE